MRALNRNAFTLMELLIGVVLLAMFATTLVVLVRSTARMTTRAGRLLLADRALFAMRVFAQEDLRDAATGDVVSLAPSRVALSRPIGEGATCADSAGVVLIADTAWTGTRTPAGGRDDALLLVDPVAAAWLRIPIDSVNRGRCPLDNAPATRLVLAAHAGVAVVARVVEPVELSAYASSGADWFGLTPASGRSPVQPFAGPLVSSATRFVVSAAALDITVPPRGTAATVVQVPLGSPQ